MAIHAPAHRPTIHFALPHGGDATTGILTAVVVIAIIVALGAVAAVARGPAGFAGEAGLAAWSQVGGDAAVAQWPTAYGLPALATLTTEAERLRDFRAAEHEGR